MSFILLAEKAQKELEAELAKLKQKESELETKASLLADQKNLLDETQTKLNDYKRELELRNELVTQKELRVRRDEDVQNDVATSEGYYQKADSALKKAEELNLDTNMKLEDLSKRELALSEKIKSYKEEVKQEITKKFLGM